MNPEDSPRFYQALSAMGLMFSDTLAKPRQKLYWDLMRDRCTIEEWEYSCHEAMRRETFHKIPLPAALMDYIYEFRTAQRQALEQEERRRQEDARLLARAERLALEASPEWQAEQAKLRAEDEERHQQYLAWLSTLTREEKIAQGLMNPPDPRRWLPLEDDRGRPWRGESTWHKLIDPKKKED